MSGDSTWDPESSDGREKTRQQWKRDRTTFQRVYDVITGVTEYTGASGIADRADCSTDGARDALTQLAEMGVVDHREGRPAEYRRNESYFQWKRVERLADEHTHAELREHLDQLLEEDADFQRSFSVPSPDSVDIARIEGGEHAAVHDRLESLSRWRTVRHDIELLQRAVSRAADRHRDGGDLGASA
ncbi:hypothetical protein PN419_08835 [Halorubrum ezzemoulense]|uniref:DUF7342 family protein n=1 Tax=Halorubrum ezzemoulense TaxID=337243 RepID=UPI002330650C|nr:hypothetical protein [Halorubrum ezzemoulense]MDB9249116.1 hypothetical protein [Halorubrum ezzemoulense]MDB9259729.1 hypothetical protein [Halorubrum ezzemoulense]MDB9263194.1 hypothetical protein [Halorubrum ezzemoulense]MDB9266376.1 hypothetical protein [Halorubrum ezzemoulense]MDB9270090.1 hypothetical protein [Halorubrum ezzemoulense]